MELKAKFGKYKKAEVDDYIVMLNKAHSDRVEALEGTVRSLNEQINRMQNELDKYKEKEGIIAKVMLDATERAKEIEADYTDRAAKSDESCRKLREEWITGMQSASLNLAKLRAEAKNVLEEIDAQFGTLCSWADNRLEGLEQAQLPIGHNEQTLEREIADGAGADLGELCRELGFSEAEPTAENASDEA